MSKGCFFGEGKSPHMIFFLKPRNEVAGKIGQLTMGSSQI